jgi:branched-subunit amino acid permease
MIVGIEWFRDLSITILGFVTSAVLIFVTVLIYRLYRKANSALQLAKSTSKIAYDTVTLVQQGPLITILTLIQGIRGGYKGISKIFKRGK